MTRKDDEGTGQPIVDVIPLMPQGIKEQGNGQVKVLFRPWRATSIDHRVRLARYISAYKDERVQSKQNLGHIRMILNSTAIKKNLSKKFVKRYNFSKNHELCTRVCTATSHRKTMAGILPFGEIAKIWRAGCIIRARFLQKITDAYENNPDIENLLLDDYFVGDH